jgi:tetratricopeptide (TPR) repeat protein
MDPIESLLEEDLHLMNDETKIERARKHNELGKEKFINRNIENAFRHFTHAIKYLITIDPLKGSAASLEIKNKMLLLLYNNTAGCHVLKGNWEYAIDLCNRVLEAEPNNVKALYRRGTALTEIQVRNPMCNQITVELGARLWLSLFLY